MADVNLRGCRILVVEDEYLLADELRLELERAEASIIGPVGQLDTAMALIAASDEIDAALLDVNLAGDYVFPAADALIARGVPLVFTTGYDASSIPPRYAHVVRCEKPVTLAKVAKAISQVIHA